MHITIKSPKAFISYAWTNQFLARRLQSDLQRDGVEVFVDYQKIAGGASLPARIKFCTKKKTPAVFLNAFSVCVFAPRANSWSPFIRAEKGKTNQDKQ